MRSKSGTVRMIDGYHRLTKLREYSSVDFDLSDEQLAAEPPLLPCRDLGRDRPRVVVTRSGLDLAGRRRRHRCSMMT